MTTEDPGSATRDWDPLVSHWAASGSAPARPNGPKPSTRDAWWTSQLAIAAANPTYTANPAVAAVGPQLTLTPAQARAWLVAMATNTAGT
jgi:hypothetical protein